jgi:protocatechuate 3,4-dioxygenase beta subunit
MLKNVWYILFIIVLIIPAPCKAGIFDIFSSEKKSQQSESIPPLSDPTSKTISPETAAKSNKVAPVIIKDEVSVDALPETKKIYTSDFIGPMQQGVNTENIPPFIKENEDIEQLACKVTPTLGPDHQNMKPIKKSNNLMRKAGSPNRAAGNYIRITGIVVDENCLPIQGAVVEIWQADNLGNYEWEYDGAHHFEMQLGGRDNNFLFSGMAQTDNRGQFYLFTIFPGSKGDNAPHINVLVKRRGYNTLYTRMYFAEHPKNDVDPIISSAGDSARESLIATGKKLDPTGKTEGRLYYFPITMRGINPYKRF